MKCFQKTLISRRKEFDRSEMADWDADDFDPDEGGKLSVPKVTDKWDGEDEDDDIKVRMPTVVLRLISAYRMLGMPSLRRRRMIARRRKRWSK